LSYIADWVFLLNQDRRKFLVDDGDRLAQEALLRLVACRAERLEREFVVGVIQDVLFDTASRAPFDHLFIGVRRCRTND
jgi:hypothetical protein